MNRLGLGGENRDEEEKSVLRDRRESWNKTERSEARDRSLVNGKRKEGAMPITGGGKKGAQKRVVGKEGLRRCADSRGSEKTPVGGDGKNNKN